MAENRGLALDVEIPPVMCRNGAVWPPMRTIATWTIATRRSGRETTVAVLVVVEYAVAQVHPRTSTFHEEDAVVAPRTSPTATL